MFVSDTHVVYSASDLAAASVCEYSLLREFDAKLGRGQGVHSDDEEMLARTSALGDEHEQRVLDHLTGTHGDGVLSFGRPAAFTREALSHAARATVEAFATAPEAVYQACVFDGDFVGFADFVIRDGDSYRVLDTKLARQAKVTALLQIAAYTDLLRAAGVPIGPVAGLMLGNQDVVEYPVDDVIGVYRRQRQRLHTLLHRHLDSGAPVAWADPNVAACLRCAACEPHLREDDDLLLVAGMRGSQRATLHDAGIVTVADLATSTQVPDGMAASTADSLRRQAQIQIRQRETSVPQWEIADPNAFGALPKPDDGDLFFDFEGDPLWTSDGQVWGLEYLFGVLDAKGTFKPMWAHDRPSERKAFVDFLKLVRKRRAKHPNMHVYHYAPYEKTALLRLATRYGVGEDEVDDLLRDEVLVDLYPLVRNGIRSGSESYGLKYLEPLYMDAELRTGEVTTATASITEYARYATLRDAGRADEAAVVLKEIADYNQYDCRSTRKLRDWLLLRAFECGVTHLTRPRAVDTSDTVVDHTAAVLNRFAGDPGLGAGRTSDQTAAALLGASRGYFQRERKPYWWAHFDRLNRPVDEWGDLSGVMLVDDAEVVADWHTPTGARKPRRHLRITGVVQGGALDSPVQLLYDQPAPAGLDDEHPDRRASSDATIIDTTAVDGVPVGVLLSEMQPAAGPFTQFPMALTPGRPIRTDKLEAAIEAVANQAAQTLELDPPQLPDTAVLDILRRRPPRTRSGGALPRGDDIASITAALLDLDHSYLAVHGPPGTGKTYTAAHVIADLVTNHHWRVGVVAQSHSTVANLLDQIVEAGVDGDRVAKKPGADHDDTAWQVIPDSQYAAFLQTHNGCVIGGTAWDFANDNRIAPGCLDLLAVDEAGQFSLASTVAVSRSATNMLLLGDPQQLPQVSTGSHPEPVDQSALGWLTAGHDVLPEEFGYFLACTHRMHPAVCQRVSALSYENRLQSHPRTGHRVLHGHEPGVRTSYVPHTGNAASSAEEAAFIVGEILALIGTSWTDERGTRALTERDILVVAPYNAQVLQVNAHLTAAGLSDVLVGTVDKIQGRQAPVVFVSMTASSLADIPRGMAFLLNRNRLNVAISRAQYLAVIVRSPALADYLPSTPDAVVELGAFLTLSP